MNSSTIDAPASPLNAQHPHRSDFVVPDYAARLFARMDSIGAGSDVQFEQEIAEFLMRPNAAEVLRRIYEESPKEETGTRWKAIFALGQMRTAEAVEVLTNVATEAAQMSPTNDSHDAGDQGFRMRYTAAIGVAHSLNVVVGTDSAIERILREGDKDISQLLGLELFSEDKLSAPWRAILNERGIFTQFRAIVGDELESIRSINPENGGHKGKDGRSRPRETTVPSIQEEE